MASHIPLAVSLLQTVTSAYPLLAGKLSSNPPPPPAPPPPPPQVPHTTPFLPPPNTSNVPLQSAPINIPGSLSSQPAPGAAGIGTSPPINTQNMCNFCHLRPRHVDGTKIHPYCSKTCANNHKSKRPSTGSAPSQVQLPASATCDFCHNRPKHFDGTKTHPFCSKACARNASVPQRRQTISGNGQANQKGTCQAPGCQNPVHTNANGSLGDYCSLAHKTLGETLCLLCLQAPKLATSHFCSQACADEAEKKGPLLLEVPQGHVTFKSVADQFKTSWRHASSCPPVRRIYKICSPSPSLAAYNTYRAGVEARGQFVAQGRSLGNENRRWHGTRRECLLGDAGNTQLCTSPTCSLCCIVRTSYDLNLFGKKTGWGRFGRGIYTSSTSSKSNDYSNNDCKSSLKAILLNKVVVGKGCKMLHDNTTLTTPPPGYDSVLAEKGGSLNHDELVVYTNDAIRPSFLVMYEP